MLVMFVPTASVYCSVYLPFHAITALNSVRVYYMAQYLTLTPVDQLQKQLDVSPFST